MVKFVCKHCNYKFDLESDKPPKKCGFCGREGTVKKESSAEDLVEEVSEIIQEAGQ